MCGITILRPIRHRRQATIPQVTITILAIRLLLYIVPNHQFIPAHQRLHRRHRVALCHLDVIHTHLVSIIRDLLHQSQESLGLQGAVICLPRSHMALPVHTIPHVLEVPHVLEAHRIQEVHHTLGNIHHRKEIRIGDPGHAHLTILPITMNLIFQNIAKVAGVLRFLVSAEKEGQAMKGFRQNYTLLLVRIDRWFGNLELLLDHQPTVHKTFVRQNLPDITIDQTKTPATTIVRLWKRRRRRPSRIKL
mmetsp:Transcript_6731/g.16432  ORF Transcript_6731/g.16432 Transcript_6731/m.16432 type:complete len:248 (+) Transcript_6731:569-1312(+)